VYLELLVLALLLVAKRQRDGLVVPVVPTTAAVAAAAVVSDSDTADCSTVSLRVAEDDDAVAVNAGGLEKNVFFVVVVVGVSP